MKAVGMAIIALACSCLIAGCDKDDMDQMFPPNEIEKETPHDNDPQGNIREGYFEVVFSPKGFPDSRAAVSGTDPRVRSLLYVIYKSTGEYVKEKTVLRPADAAPVWPLGSLRDTLPKGEYSVVFLANMDQTQFPIQKTGGTEYASILTDYKTTRTNARINLPGADFTDSSEFYYASIGFSDATPQPSVLLQRIISMLNLRRVFVDSQTALNSLTNNIVTQIGYKNIIQTTVQGVMPGLLKKAMDKGTVGNTIYSAVGGLDAAVNLVTAALIQPVTDALYELFLQRLVNEIGLTLSGNATQNGALGALGNLLNPWRSSDASYALVTIRDFPKAIDLDLNVTDTYTGDHRFRYSFTTTPGTTNSEKDILIRGFHGLLNIREIHVARAGLISGLLVDDVIDGSLLLNGAFVNITDPLQATVETNYRYLSEYSFVSLGLKSYTQQTDGNHSLTLSVKLSDIANLDGILGGIPLLGSILNSTLKALIGNVVVSVPVNLPLLGVDNLSLSGSWKTPPVKY